MNRAAIRRLYNWPQTVKMIIKKLWPDGEIKTGPIFTNVAQNQCKVVFYLKREIFIIAKKSWPIFGQPCHKDHSKVAKSGSTDYLFEGWLRSAWPDWAILWKVLVTNFIIKCALIFGNFWLFWKIRLEGKTTVASF